MASNFLKKRIDIVKREMSGILIGWSAIDIFISEDDRADYEAMATALKLARAVLEVNALMITEPERRCATCKYNVRDSHPEGDWFCACFRSEHFTDHTGDGAFECCSQWEDGTNEEN